MQPTWAFWPSTAGRRQLRGPARSWPSSVHRGKKPRPVGVHHSPVHQAEEELARPGNLVRRDAKPVPPEAAVPRCLTGLASQAGPAKEREAQEARQGAQGAREAGPSGHGQPRPTGAWKARSRYVFLLISFISFYSFAVFPIRLHQQLK